MKALLRKDYYVLKSAILLYAGIILLFNMMMGLSGIFITVLYSALLPSSAFAYDDRSRWGELAAMLPYSERDIVLSRYALGVIGIVLLNIPGMLARLAVRMLNMPFSSSIGLSLSETLIFLCIGVCFLDFSLPAYFRFDAEKSRLARTLITVLLCGGISGVIVGVGINDDSMFGLFQGTFVPILIAAVILTAISIPLSLWAYRARKG